MLFFIAYARPHRSVTVAVFLATTAVLDTRVGLTDGTCQVAAVTGRLARKRCCGNKVHMNIIVVFFMCLSCFKSELLEFSIIIHMHVTLCVITN